MLYSFFFNTSRHIVSGAGQIKTNESFHVPFVSNFALILKCKLQNF